MGDQYDTILKAFKTALKTEPRSEKSKMSGKLNELKSGDFADAAGGLRTFLKVPESWNETEACTIEGMEEEGKIQNSNLKFQGRESCSVHSPRAAKLGVSVGKDLVVLEEALDFGGGGFRGI